MGFLDLTVVSQTRETKPIDGWVYRIIENEFGTAVHRVPVDSQLWSHGTYKQIYQVDEEKFVPTCVSGLKVWTDFKTALEVCLKGL